MTTPTKGSRALVRDPSTGRIAKFVPTVEQRQLVQKLASIDCSQDEILFVVPWGRPDEKPIDEKTLRKYFGPELAKGRAMRGVKIKQGLFDLAMSGNVTALIFLAKSRLGWSETLKVEQTGKDGAPLPGPVLYLPAKEQLSDEAIPMFERRVAEPGPVSAPWQSPQTSAADSHTGIEVGDAREGGATVYGAMRVSNAYPTSADPLRSLRPS